MGINANWSKPEVVQKEVKDYFAYCVHKLNDKMLVTLFDFSSSSEMVIMVRQADSSELAVDKAMQGQPTSCVIPAHGVVLLTLPTLPGTATKTVR